MATIVKPYTFSPNTTIESAQVNSDFDDIYAEFNGGITNANISPTAAIATSKINTTFPSGAIVGTTDTQTLTNKTLTTPALTKPTLTGSIQVITAMAAQAIDGSLGNIFTRTLAGSETFTQSNISTGQCILVRVKQGSGTTYTVTWFSGVTWITSGATAPVQTTTSNGYTTYGLICTGSNTFDGYLVGTN